LSFLNALRDRPGQHQEMLSPFEYQREADAADRKAASATDVQTKKAYETIANAYRLLAKRAALREHYQGTAH
jgi:hypothetical protein